MSALSRRALLASVVAAPLSTPTAAEPAVRVQWTASDYTAFNEHVRRLCESGDAFRPRMLVAREAARGQGGDL